MPVYIKPVYLNKQPKIIAQTEISHELFFIIRLRSKVSVSVSGKSGSQHLLSLPRAHVQNCRVRSDQISRQEDLDLGRHAQNDSGRNTKI